MKKFLTMVFVVSIFATTLNVADATFKNANTIPSVVLLEVQDSQGNWQTGSGTIISNDAVILTAAHVITDTTTNKPAEYIDICLINTEYDVPSCEYSGRVLTYDTNVAYDPDLDLALIIPAYKLDENREEIGNFLSVEDMQNIALPYSDFADFKPGLGGKIKILGYPAASLTGTVSLTEGIVSGFIPYDENNNWVIQTDAIVNPGNSGGPAFNEDEKILGVVEAISLTGEGGNYGYVTDADMVLLWFLKLVDQGVLNKDFVSEIFSNDKIEQVDQSLGSKIFNDVDFTSPNAEAINYLKNNNIIGGYPDGSFRPADSLNRAELLKVIIEGAGYNSNSLNGENCFKDVKETEWYSKYICFAKDQNWIGGYSDGTFKPDSNVKKSEALKMLLETFGVTLTEPDANPYDDVGKDEWYAKYVNTAKTLGLLEESSIFYHPANDMTRGQISENIYRLLLQPNATDVTESTTGTDGKYTSEADNYSMEFPKDWEVTEDLSYGTGVMAISQRENASDTFRENINVISEVLPSAMTLDDYYKLSIDNAAASLPGFTKIKEGTKTINGIKSKWIIYTEEYEGTKIEVLVYVLVKDLKAFVITCGSIPSEFDKYKSQFEEIVGTFKLGS
jgi:V8-like Glu-specific endopeptidase